MKIVPPPQVSNLKIAGSHGVHRATYMHPLGMMVKGRAMRLTTTGGREIVNFIPLLSTGEESKMFTVATAEKVMLDGWHD